jgi:GTP-binding protein EngB required for normal cell division
MIQVNGLLDHVAELADGFHLANLQPRIAACRELLHRRSGIEVAVFGRFKAGKSSFLNHLTGRAVLPIGVVPLTAVITRLRYGQRDRAAVRFLNGKAENIPFDQIGCYVGESENPKNRKEVASVEVELPELKALAPLQFVDTPGLGSAFAHNTEAALNWLPNVGAALVAVSSDAPLSERDLGLLEELRRHTPKIVLLLTKADLLTEAQRVEVLDFVQRQLHQKGDGPWPVFFYSIQPRLAGLKAQLEQNLLHPLMDSGARTADQILRHKMAALVSQTRSYLQIALAAATQAESSRQVLRNKLEEERKQFDVLREELRLLANEWSARAMEWSLTQLLPVQRQMQEKVTAELHAQFGRWHLRLPAFIEAYRHWLRSFMKHELSHVSQTQRAMFREPLAKARQHVSRMLRAFQDRLAGHVKTALGIGLAPHEISLAAPEPEEPSLDVSTEFMVPMDVLGYIIPMTICRPMVERNLLRRARYEVEKNLSRMAADWCEHVSAAIEEMRAQAERYARNELAALEQTLAQINSNEGELRKIIGELDGCPEAIGDPRP